MSGVVKKTYYPRLAWFVVLLIYVMQNGLLVMPESLIHPLQQAFRADTAQVALYSSMFLYAWIIFQVPAGVLFDRYTSRSLVMVSTIALLLACLLQSITINYDLSLLCRFVMGAAGSFSFIALLYMARSWFSLAMLPMMIGLAEGSTSISEVGMPLALTQTFSHVHWQLVTFCIGIIFLLLFLFAAWLVFDRPKQNVHKVSCRVSLNIKHIVTNKYLWGLGLYVGFAVAYFVVMGDMWGPAWIRYEYHLTAVHAVYVNSVVIIGYMIGAPCLGYIERYIKIRHLICMTMAIELLLMIMVAYVFKSFVSHVVCLFFLGFFTGGIVLAFDLAKDVVVEAHYGLAIGFLNMFYGGIGMLMSPVLMAIIAYHRHLVFYIPLLWQITAVIGFCVSACIAINYKPYRLKNWLKKGSLQ